MLLLIDLDAITKKQTYIFTIKKIMKITFIGLGIMGSRMATNLLRNNVDLTVFNRSKEPVEKLVALGARASETANEAVKEADLVFTMLSNPEAVESTMLGEEGAITKIKMGALWVDCSTVNPSFSMLASQSAEELGVLFMDAPVAGTLPHAENAQLTFFTGGTIEAVEKANPYMQMMGQKVLHIGETGKGASYKMLVNMMLAQSMIIFSEAVLLGEKMGMDRDFLLDALPKAPVVAPFIQFKKEMLRNGQYDVMFPLELMHKDLHLAAVSAYECNQPLLMANLAKEIYAKANQSGLGRMDFAAVHQYLSASEKT